MTIQAYLNFNGNAREALDFYAEAFNAERPQVMLFEDMPADPARPLDDNIKKLVANAVIKLPGGAIMASDVPPWMPFTAGNNFSLIVSSKNADELKALFGKLKEGGQIGMDLQETFWSKCYGTLTDKFGISWQVNQESTEPAL